MQGAGVNFGVTAARALEENARDLRGVHLRDLFASDAKRGERLVVEVEVVRGDAAHIVLDCRLVL